MIYFLLKIFKSIFFIDILVGMFITFKNFFCKKITVFYPEEKTLKSVRFRGLHALRRYDNGLERCIACKLCESICPAMAITIESSPSYDNIRATTKYDIDLFKCIYCGLCEEACPVGSIVETTYTDFHFEDYNDRVINKNDLLSFGSKSEKEISKNLKDRLR